MKPDPPFKTLSREEQRRSIIRRYRRTIGRCEALLRDQELYNARRFMRGENPLPVDRETIRTLSVEDRGLADFIAKNGDADERDDTVYHKWKLTRSDGATSPLCEDQPRAVDLAVEACILADDYVTCEACKARMEATHA